jgi:hypothetical protein
MPEIIVTAGHDGQDDGGAVMLRERVNAADFESERFAANLVERLGWAVVDAAEAEAVKPAEQEAGPSTRREKPKRERPLEPIGSA